MIFFKDVGSGDSILFAPRLPDEYAVWMGKIKSVSHFKVIILSMMFFIMHRETRQWHRLTFFRIVGATGFLCHLYVGWCIHIYDLCIHILQEHYKVTTVCFTDEIATVLQQNYQGSGKPLLFLLHGLNTDSNNFAKPAEFQVLSSYHYYHYFFSIQLSISLPSIVYDNVIK